MRAKFIYEKFENESDPVSDMGIGGIPTEIKKVFNNMFSNYGELDFYFSDNLKIIEVFIPYKSRNERNKILEKLNKGRHAYSSSIPPPPSYFTNRIDADVDDILEAKGKDLWGMYVWRSKSFKNKSGFHKKNRGMICRIETCELTNDTEAEW